MKGECPSHVAIQEGTLRINKDAFQNCTNLINITFPDSLKSIGEYAFYRCSRLTSVIIPYSVTSIGHSAFSHCTNLSSAIISDSIKSIDALFSDCSNLTSVTIPDSVTSIGFNAFSDCNSLRSVIIPNSVTHIGTKAFYCCESLNSIVIPESVKSIDKEAFMGCRRLSSINLPDSISEIGEDAFWGTDWYNNQPDGIVYVGKVANAIKGKCPTSIEIKKGTVSIRRCAFKNCYNLSTITIPDSVEYIGEDAFSETSWYYNQASDVIYAGKVLYKAQVDSPSEIVIQEGTLGIAGHAFEDCDDLELVIIPDSVKCIGTYAFLGCPSLEFVIIPKSVAEIKYRAFGYYYTRDNTEEPIKVNDFTIYGYEGSEAERYANDNDFTFCVL